MVCACMCMCVCLCACVCMCVHMCVCTYRYTCVCGCAWKPQGNLHHQSVLPSRQRFSLACSSTRPGWLARESSPVCLLGTGIISTPAHPDFLLGCWTSNSGPLKMTSNQAISSAPLRNFWKNGAYASYLRCQFCQYFKLGGM